MSSEAFRRSFTRYRNQEFDQVADGMLLCFDYFKVKSFYRIYDVY